MLEAGEAIHRKHDAVIIPEGGPSGRKQYTLHTFGEPISSHSTLKDAKEALHSVYGPLKWQKANPEPLKVTHRYYGPSTEWSDPQTYHYVDSLPKL